jgi:hypothetical protein
LPAPPKAGKGRRTLLSLSRACFVLLDRMKLG